MKKVIGLSSRIQKPLAVGIVVLFVSVGGFGGWALFAPLDSSAVAQGTVIVDTYPKEVQHLEGGIVEKIYIHEGDAVKEGDPLIALEKTQAGAEMGLLTDRYYALLALESRLVAEKNHEKDIVFPEDILTASKKDVIVAKSIQAQKTEFAARQLEIDGVKSILKKRISQLGEEIESLQSQVESSTSQSALIQKELVAVEEMVEKEYMPVSDLYALQREAARLKGNSDERLALISRARQSIGETELQIIQNEHERRAEVLEELRDTRNQLAELEEQMRASSDVLQRTLIVAPRTGKVMNLRVHTLGGIIKPGDTLMTIIPKQDNLVVEARINPLDIDVVEPGLPVKVQLTAYKMRDTPTLKGEVTQVSGDVLQDNATGERYYLTRIVIDARSLSDEALLTLYPGMPVNVMIVVDTRSMLSYLLAPLKASFTRAFNEQ